MSRNALFSPYDSYILGGATWSGTTPISSYALSTFGYLRPDWRVKWNVKTLTVTATIGSGKQADVVAIPMSNLDTGTSPTILRLTNNQGLDVVVEIPAVPEDGIPLTAVYDFRLAPNAGTPATVWNFIIANNSVDVTLGALLWLGRLTELNPNFRPSPIWSEQQHNTSVPNASGAVNVVEHGTRTRWVDLAVPSRDAQRDQLIAWARAGRGSARPSLFWPDPAVNDALIGSWPDEYANTWVIANFSPMDFRFTEKPKGPALI